MDELEEFEAAHGARSAQELRQHQDISAILIYTTFPSQSEAKKLGRALVESGLAACLNIFPQMLAIFWRRRGFHALDRRTVRGRKNDSRAIYKEQFGAVPVNGCHLPQSWA